MAEFLLSLISLRVQGADEEPQRGPVRCVRGFSRQSDERTKCPSPQREKV